MRLSLLTGATALAAAISALPLHAQDAPATQVVYRGTEGIGAGKHIVFVTGDEVSQFLDAGGL